MSGFKKSQPGLRFSAEKITPDEIDAYKVINMRPAINEAWWASAGTAGTSAVVACVVINRLPDYPRNINFAIAGSHGSIVGTLVANGKDQFGSTITETLVFARANNGGTIVGTKVFAQFTSGTVSYGTVGAGTPKIGFVPGTDCLLGLPYKLSGTNDVVQLGYNIGTGAVSYGGGTIAAFVDVPMSAIRPAAALDGTAVVNCWFKPTYNAENMAVVANLSQAV
jgi:hypothetical protein